MVNHFIIITVLIVTSNAHPMFNTAEIMVADSGPDVELTTASEATTPMVTTEYLLTEPTVESVDVTVTVDPLENDNATEITTTMPIDFNSFTHMNPSMNGPDSDSSLPMPSILSEATLSGQTGIMTIEPVIFPNWTPLSWPSSIRSFVNAVARIPLMLIGSMLGQSAELLGLQTMQVGNALLAAGVQGLGVCNSNKPQVLLTEKLPRTGFTLKDYSIGFIAFGQTVKEWFADFEAPGNTTSTATDGLPSYGNLWQALGNRYYETRLETEQLYGSQY